MSIDLFLASTVFLGSAIVLYAFRRGSIDSSAVFASGVVGLAAILGIGTEWFYLILGFFVFGNLVTRYRFEQKRSGGMAQERRNYQNVFGNGGAAVFFAALYWATGSPAALMGFVGSMATAASDTFATEIGVVHLKQPVMITNLKKTSAGTNGAVSLEGSVAALLGAASIAIIPVFFPDVQILLGSPLDVFLIGTLAGFLGCFFDSFVGATLEGRLRIFDNHMTNYIATLGGGAIAAVIYALAF